MKVPGPFHERFRALKRELEKLPQTYASNRALRSLDEVILWTAVASSGANDPMHMVERQVQAEAMKRQVQAEAMKHPLPPQWKPNECGFCGSHACGGGCAL